MKPQPKSTLTRTALRLAAASVAIVGGARRVHALLMSEDAKELLEKRGIAAMAERSCRRS